MRLKLNCYQLRENYKSLCKPQGNHKEKPTIYTHTHKRKKMEANHNQKNRQITKETREKRTKQLQSREQTIKNVNIKSSLINNYFQCKQVKLPQ